MGRLRTFFESTDFDEMGPNDDVAVSGVEWALSTSNDEKLIAYGRNTGGSIELAVPDGTYELRWFDPVTGQSVTETEVAASGGSLSRSAPAAFGNELAVYVRKSGDVVRPSPPTELIAE